MRCRTTAACSVFFAAALPNGGLEGLLMTGAEDPLTRSDHRRARLPG